MPLFKSRAPPQNELDVLLESISKGQYDDEAINELKRLVDTSSDSEVDRVAESLLGNIMKTDEPNVLIGTVKALTVMPFLPEGRDEHIIRLLVTLFAVPQNTRITLQHKILQNEILKFLLSMLKADQRYAPLMMTELIASLEYAYIAKDAEAYAALEMLAASKPEYFRPHAETLVKLLGSINKATRAQSAKLIGIIGAKYPEYVSSAMPVLQSLASFYPDAHVKHNASEAYQVLYHGLRLDIVETVAMKEDDKPKQRSLGFADILKKKAAELLSKPPQDTPGERQRAARSAARDRLAHERGISTQAADNLISKPPARQEADAESDEIPLADMEGFESEIKDILDKTRDDFSNDAEGILNSIGVGHLSIKNRDKLTITSTEALSGGIMLSGSGLSSQPPEADKPPIHARSSHLDGKSKPRSNSGRTVHSKAMEPENPAGTVPPETNPEESTATHAGAGAHGSHSAPIKAGFKTDLHGDAEARSIHRSSGLVRTSAIEKTPESRDTTKLPHAGTKEVQATPTPTTVPENNEKPVMHVEKTANVEPVKPEETAARSEAKHAKPAATEIPHDKLVKESDPPAKRVEKAIAWTDKSEAHEPKAPEEPAAKRVEKAIAWFEKVGVPGPAPKAVHHAGATQQPARESGKTAPGPQHHATHAGTEPQPARVEAHASQQDVKPETMPQHQPEAEKAPKAEAAPEKHALPKHEHKIESSVLPPRAAVSKHEKVSPSDPITPPVARKIGVSKIGMTDKPLESYGSAEEGKKEAVVPSTSISGFGPNKRIYKCPKCGARTLVEGELCKICKMTMERPQEMVRCERCGLINNRNVRFCRKCGAKLEKGTKTPE
jgi:hypothetical protein